MKEKDISTNADLGQTNQSDITKFDSVHDAEFTSEWAWANNFVEQVGRDLLGTPLQEPGMCVLLEWAFRTGHRLGVNVAGKDQIDTSQHNEIFDKAFEACRRDFKKYEDPG